ncbi:uncharacterized protein [Dermacentor albipictus]|uniref:uncharacterized protein n=1 Tax=Dermacentor albipictus TaxID=60249 RepID=UPI0031FD9E95
MDVLPSFRELFAVVVLFGAIRGSSESEGKELVITVPSGKVARRVDDDLNLTCKVASDERFHITWVTLQDKMRQAHRIKIESEHFNEKTVTIYHLEESDTGWYTCVARHHDSNVNRVFNRTVYVSVSTYASSGRRPCYNQSFVCGNGYCIPKRYACDGHVDCHDSSDEAPKHCGPDPCEDKVLCEDGRCLPRSLCCDPATQPDCRVTYVLPCCKKYLASIANTTTSLVGVLARPPHQRVGASVEYLQSSVYTVVSCAVVFILVATVMVAAICRIHMRRAVMASPFPFVSSHADHRCLPWCRPLHHPVTTTGMSFGEGAPASCTHLAGADLRTVTCAHGSYVVATYSSSGTPGGRPKLHFLQQLPKPPEYSPLAQGPPPPYQSTEQLATAGSKESSTGTQATSVANTSGVTTRGSSATHPWPCHLWPRDESPPPCFSSLQDLSECEAQCLLPAFEEAVASNDRYDADVAGFHRAPFRDDPAFAGEQVEPLSGSSSDCTLAAGGRSSSRLPETSNSPTMGTHLHDEPFYSVPAFVSRLESLAVSDCQAPSFGDTGGGNACQESVNVERRAST